MPRLLSRFTAALALLAALGGAASGCGGAADSYGLIGGEKVDATTIDRDPLALLPSGVLVVGYLDAATMFKSKWGPEVGQVITNLLPLGPESNFSPQRDVVRAYGGVYAMQGADFCAVVQGNFDVDAIRRAADARAITINGAPLVKTRYADNDMFTSGNLGFVVLTSHTVLTGNETGMRRALDRLRSGKLERNVPTWMVDLLQTKEATLAIAGDLGAQPAVEAVAGRYPFLSGIRTVRALGNFKPPGLNIAGALTYRDRPSADAAAASISQLNQLGSFLSLLSMFGFGATLPPIQTAQSQNDVAFTTAVDDSLVQTLVRMGVEMTRRAATVTPAR